MTGDNEIDVNISAQINELSAGMDQAKTEVAQTAQQMSASLNTMANDTERHMGRSGAAFMAARVGAHELTHAIGITGIAGRLLGHELADLVISAGSMGMGFALISGAATVATMIYEHFAKATEKLRQEQEKLTEEARKWIDAADQAGGKTERLWRAEYQDYLDTYNKSVKDLTDGIKRMRQEVEELSAKTQKYRVIDRDGAEDTIARTDQEIDKTKQLISEKQKLIEHDEARLGSLSKKSFSEFKGNEKPMSDQEVAQYQLLNDMLELQTGLENIKYNQFAEAYAKEIDLINQKEEAEKRYQDTLKQTKALMEPIYSNFNTAVSGMIVGSESLADAVHNMAIGIINDFVIMGLKAIEASITEAIAKKAAATADVTNAAASTGAQTAAALAPAGPEVAIPAGVAANAVVLSTFLPQLMIPAAARGFDIPAGVNPLTQLHQREMVLPAPIADKIRNMSEGGGNHVHLHGVDTKDIRRVLYENQDVIFDVIKKGRRNFKL